MTREVIGTRLKFELNIQFQLKKFIHLISQFIVQQYLCMERENDKLDVDDAPHQI